MNTLSTMSRTDPYGKVTDCIQFTIDDPSCSFVLSNIMTVGRQYTFSLWLMSDENSSISADGHTFATNSSWNKHSVTFTASSADLLLNFGDPGVYYAYHPQLEIGNKATDWTPAPEDVDESIVNATDEVRESMVDQNTTIMQNCESIIMSTFEQCVKTGDYESFKETVESQLQLLNDQMSLKFTETTAQLNSDISGLQNQINTITTYFTFDIDGMVIGRVDNPNKVEIAHDEIIISSNGQEVQRFDAEGNAITPKLNVTQSLNLLGLLVEEDGDDLINCEYVGE